MTSKSAVLTVVAASMAIACVLFRLPAVAATAPRAIAPVTPTAKTQQPPKKPPVGPVITGVELYQVKTLLEQPCPVVLVFQGKITTTRPTSVTYTWVDSHGRTWPDHHRRFTLAGSNGVSHKWKLGKPGKTVDAWVQLKVISPESRSSSKVPVHFTCGK
jgi:hypothetical protein